MSTHNICFHGEIRKYICLMHLLSGALMSDQSLRWAHFGQPMIKFIQAESELRLIRLCRCAGSGSMLI